MKEYKHGRSRKQQKIDRNQAYDEGEVHVDSKARERFRRKPYEVDDVAGYMAKKYDIKKEVEP